MPKLYDEVIEIAKMNKSDSPYVKILAESLPFCQIFLATNVQALIKPDAGFEVSTDFPSAVPPYEFTWVEWSVPPEFAEAIKFPELRRAGTLTHLSKIDEEFVLMIYGVTEMMLPDPAISIFPGYAKYSMNLDGQGLNGKIAVDAPARTTMPDDGLGALLVPTFMTFSLLNCKNVNTVEKEPYKNEIQRWAQRGHKCPLCRFHTLNISTMAKALKSEGNIDSNGPAKALHLCRGHFKAYNEKGLFGKHKGMFYFGPTIKGNKKVGIVTKDYNVGG